MLQSTLSTSPRSNFCSRLRARASNVITTSNTTLTSTNLNSSTRLHLSRTLGKLDVTLVGVGASIGAGIFVVSGEAARVAGPAVVLSFFIAAVVCVFNALCYAEMASRVPISGSAYVYSMSIFGEFAAAVTGINLLFDYHIGAALIARNLVHYVLRLLEAMGLSNLPSWLVAIPVPGLPFLSVSFTAPIVLCLLGSVLCCGIRESARANNILTGLKMSIVVFVVIAGVTAVDSNNWVPFAPKGTSSVFQASSLVFFAYIGFDAVCNTAEECVSPKEDLPFGIVTSLLICAMLYAGVTLVLTGLTPFEKLPADASLSAAFDGHNMDWIKVVIDIGAIIGLTTTLFLGLYSQSRMYLAIARDRLLPAGLAHITENDVPRNATVVCCVVASVLAACFDVVKLSNLLDMGILLAYSVVCSCVLVVRANDISGSSNGAGINRVGEGHQDAGGGGGGSIIENRRRNVVRCYVAVAALSLLPLLPGLAVTNSWNVHIAVLVSYSIVGLVVCTALVRRVKFGGGTPINSTGANAEGGEDIKDEDVGGEGGTFFACPLVPLIPSLGLASNSYLMAQRPWVGWVRLLVITLIVLIIYVVMVLKSDNSDETLVPLLSTLNEEKEERT